MDNGAHFYNCDFQVHTPRDRRWHGPNAISNDEREDYAEEFIQACRDKGLDAVAITDHHDMVFIEYIRDAAKNETDADGNLVPEKDRIVVFPGMELTLGVPCQALLIFDSDLSLGLLQKAQTLLNIDPSPSDQRTTRQPERLDVDSLNDVYNALDSNSALQGRYTILPNVSDGGTGTLLRSQFQNVYKKMPCVGGYTDGAVSSLGRGARKIVNGDNVSYGNKAIGLFQTSDNRSRNYQDLGTHTTWVKWARPTAEALRQACLARKSRLHHEQPRLPSEFLNRVSVCDSLFMGDFELSFNRQYSALIGGRGTGKSTVLEYLRWALGDEPVAENLSDAEKKRKNLVQKTLVERGGHVEVELSINGVSHVVRRDGADEGFELKVGENDFEDVPKKEVRELLPIQAYSQKQLSSVAVRIDELNRFVRAPIQGELRKLNSKLQSLESDLRSTYIRVQKKRELESRSAAIDREISSVRQQIEETKNEMTGLDDKGREILDQKEVYDREKAIIQQWKEDVQAVRSQLEVLEGLTATANPDDARGLIENHTVQGEQDRSELEYPDDDLLAEMRDQLVDLFDAINERALEGIEDIDDLLDDGSEYGEVKLRLEDRLETFEEKYSSVREQADAQSEQMKRLDELDTRQEELTEEKQATDSQLDELEEPREVFDQKREEWLEVHSRRSNILEVQCNALTEQSGKRIRATLEVGGQTKQFVDLLKQKVKGSNLYGATVESIFASIHDSSDPIAQYSEIMQDLEKLALHNVEESSDLPSTPTLAECDLEEQHCEKIARYLSPEDWLDLAVTPLDDQPEFEYNARQGNYIDFASASAGQQATALLQALLNQSGPPLIIDQPEDDLDNQVIQEVVEEIWSAKHERQLIFASHNANLVVNGDADLVVCFDSSLEDGGSRGKIEHTGAIDIEEIRDQITDIMEGGQKAFELRKAKYGF